MLISVSTRTLISHSTQELNIRNCFVAITRSTTTTRYSSSSWDSLFSLFSTPPTQKSVPTPLLRPNINCAASTTRTNHHFLPLLRTNTPVQLAKSSFCSLIHSTWYDNHIPTESFARNMSSSTGNNDAAVTASAIQLLKDTPYFYSASDSLLQTLASKRTYAYFV